MSYSNQITPGPYSFSLGYYNTCPLSSSRLSTPPPPHPPHSLTRLRQNILQNARKNPSTAKKGRYFSPNKSQMIYGASEFLMNVQHKILIRISSYLFLGVFLFSTFDSNEISPLETDPNMTGSVNDKPLLHKAYQLPLEENQRKTWTDTKQVYC